MVSGIFLLTAAMVGVNFGWEPLPAPEKGMKYIVQFDPAALRDAERAGQSLESDIPSTVGDVRSISIRMGTGDLPKTNPPAPPKAAKETTPAPESSSPGETPKPWTLITVSICLFVSIAANIYLLWIYAELRKRYRALLEK